MQHAKGMKTCILYSHLARDFPTWCMSLPLKRENKSPMGIEFTFEKNVFKIQHAKL